ncbi:MAG: bifunctional YncE family protein/alkaline phosphatase family protein [Candidatus Hydrogenedentes bacterium]|nr:bifunctional YncE family protein/alkaline phosphatase family protein [Candidatus Hydrogenedentota bacterium]
MRYFQSLLALAVIGCATTDGLDRAKVGRNEDGTYTAATQQTIDSAGEMAQFPGRPTDLALSPDGAVLAVKNFKDIVFMNAATHAVIQTLALPDKRGNSPFGIAWKQDGKGLWTSEAQATLLYAERGPDGSFAWGKDSAVALPGPKPKEGTSRGGSAPGGFFVDEAAGLAYVALSRNNAVGVVNLTAKKIDEEIPVGIAPYTVLRHGAKAYVTNWGGRRPKEGDLTGPTSGSQAVVNPKTGIASTGSVSVIELASKRVVKEIVVDLHPSGMALAPDGKRLYVANANSDTISVIDTISDERVQTFDVKPKKELPFGSAPNAVAVSADGALLYVANGGNNAVAVLDAAQGAIKGFIPTGWYPGAVLLGENGKTLCIANVKGVGSLYEKANLAEKKKDIGGDVRGHNSHDHMGSVTFVEVPNAAQLERYTLRVGENMRLPLLTKALGMKTAAERVMPVPIRPGDVSPIKHVLYIIKENRTYDQVFGDMPQGNGEPKLCQFGREVTPNHHALAEEFVLLDNFYCNGVLSADGHQWTDEGYVTDYLEKSFGGFPRSYPYEGEDAVAFASSGFIWDKVLEKGLTFRDYGEFVNAKIEPGSATWDDIHNDLLKGERKVNVRAATPLKTLEPYLCPTFIGFPLKVQDVYRVEEFLKEFKEFEAKGNLPNFMIMLLPGDHTAGTRPGMPTPRACVADNDLAVGRIVDAISHSKFWPETAIFTVEDDPQAGLDHVDGHRTVALCVSPYTKRGKVDSTFYNQTGMLRTIELILGLPPLNQIDMASTPMSNAFTNKPDLRPYTVKPNQIPLDEMNPKLTALRGKQRYWAEQSIKQPLDELDKADEDTLNSIIWHSVKGYDTPYPKMARASRAKGDD